MGRTANEQKWQTACLHSVAFVFCLMKSIVPALALEIPSNMTVFGQITTPDRSSISARLGDRVRAVEINTQNDLGIGAVIDNDGTFVVDLSRSATDNGAVFMLILVGQQGSYRLFNGTNLATLVFSGGLFPSRLSIGLTIGTQIAGTSSIPMEPAGSHTLNPRPMVPPELVRFAVLKRDTFDDADIEAIKAAVAKRVQSATYDVNGDGIVNTRDLIDAIKALSRYRDASRPRSGSPREILDAGAGQ